MTDWSDGHSRKREHPAIGLDGDCRVLVDVYGLAVAHEHKRGVWTVTVGGDWSTMLDLAEAILAADKERQ